ncbi:MAG: hypothetical protein Q9167_004385 [Letrouitia subvulpina]
MTAFLWATRLRIFLIFLGASLALLCFAPTQVFYRWFIGRQAVAKDCSGAVVSESKLCTKIGIDLFKAGGNAADALVGTTFCVGVVGMYHSGIGGGGFALARSVGGSYESIDFRERAPATADVDMFKNNVEGSILGGLASGVPGELRGLDYIHKKHGRLHWSQVLRPAINVARYGFPVTHDLLLAMGIPSTHDRRSTEKTVNGFDFLTDDPAWAVDFAPNGTRLSLGDIMTRKRYANTLETIASEGADALYNGRMAEHMVSAVQKTNGSIVLKDLQDYSVTIRRPVQIDYHGFRVLACGVPASGAVPLSVLKTLEGYKNFASLETVNLSAHRLDEAMRFGYGKRASFGDPDFLEDMHDLEQSMLDAKYAASIREKISDKHTLNVSAYDPSGFENRESHGTSHISAADASGLAISLTTTVNLFFGSHLMVPETGVIMNSQMNDFSIPNTTNVFGYKPSPANYIRPRKRPLSSISPLLIAHSANNTLYALVGSAGGSRIITAVAQNAISILTEGLGNAYDAVAKPRLHDQLMPNTVSFEWSYDNGTTAFMRGRGHNVTWVGPGRLHCSPLLGLSRPRPRGRDKYHG